MSERVASRKKRCRVTVFGDAWSARDTSENRVVESICRGDCLLQEESSRIGRGHEEETSHCAGTDKISGAVATLYASGYFENAPYPSLKGASSVLESLSRDNPRARTADPKSVIDASIVKELDDPALSRSSTNRRSKWHCLSKSAPIQVTAC
jgi:hypothetical protein